MTREELIKQCKYYKGEEECPYANDTNEGFFWFIERQYIQRAVNVGIDEYCRYREDIVRSYIKTHPQEKNIYTAKDISIHTKGIATFIEAMSEKWLPYRDNMVFFY